MATPSVSTTMSYFDNTSFAHLVGGDVIGTTTNQTASIWEPPFAK